MYNDYYEIESMIENWLEGTVLGATLIVNIILIIIALIASVVPLAMFLLQGYSLYTIAKRRGIDKAWLAWIPVGCVWIIGKIYDDYQWRVNRQKREFARIMFILSLVTVIGNMVVAFLYMIGAILSIIGIGVLIMGFVAMLEVPLGVIGLIAIVLQYICLYDVMRSCDSKNLVLFFVLGLVFGILPVFLFLICKKDLGMNVVPEGQSPVVEMFEEDI